MIWLTEAQADALTALQEVDSINQEAEENLAVTEQLRAQLSPVTDAAREGLTLASEAYDIAEGERQVNTMCLQSLSNNPCSS